MTIRNPYNLHVACMMLHERPQSTFKIICFQVRMIGIALPANHENYTVWDGQLFIAVHATSRRQRCLVVSSFAISPSRSGMEKMRCVVVI